VSHIQGADGLQIKFDRLLVGVSEPAVRKALTGVGMDVKNKDMPTGFKQDLGADKAMSNWPRRGDKMELRTDFKVAPYELTVRPQGKSYGPLSMLQNGRTPRRGGQFRARGSRIGKGGAVTRLALVSRTVGPMAAKETWSDGAEVVERNMPKRLQVWLRSVANNSRIGR
jgi:hypothetical protein